MFWIVFELHLISAFEEELVLRCGDHAQQRLIVAQIADDCLLTQFRSAGQAVWSFVPSAVKNCSKSFAKKGGVAPLVAHSKSYKWLSGDLTTVDSLVFRA